MFIRVEKKKILIFLSVLVFVWYGFTVGWEGKIWPGGEIYLNKFLYIFSSIIILYYERDKRSLKSMILPIAMIFVVCFFNNANNARNHTMPTWSICACLLFYCIANNTNVWHRYFMKLLVAVGIFYSFTTVLSMVMPSFFYNVSIPFFSHYGYSSQMIAIYRSGYITGFTPHYSTNAMYLAVTLGACIAFGFVWKFSKIWMNVLSVFIFACILFTGKRAHSIFLLAAILVVYLSIHCDEPIKKWGKILIISIVAIVVFTIAAQLIPQLFNVINRFIEAKDAGDIELGRGVTRAMALEVWSENPFFGIGWDAFKYYYREMNGILLNVHCVYIQLLCETGIIGAFPFYLFFVSSLVKAIILLRKMTLDKEVNDYKHLALIYSVLVQVFFLLYCFTGNPLYDNPTLYTYLLGCTMSEFYWLNSKKIR